MQQMVFVAIYACYRLSEKARAMPTPNYLGTPAPLIRESGHPRPTGAQGELSADNKVGRDMRLLQSRIGPVYFHTEFIARCGIRLEVGAQQQRRNILQGFAHPCPKQRGREEWIQADGLCVAEANAGRYGRNPSMSGNRYYLVYLRSGVADAERAPTGHLLRERGVPLYNNRLIREA